MSDTSPAASLYTHLVEWRKNFLDGPLVGLSAPLRSRHTGYDKVLNYANWLRQSTPERPHADIITGTRWYATQVTVTGLTPHP